MCSTHPWPATGLSTTRPPIELIVEFATTVGLGIDARSTTGVSRPAGRRGADDRRSVDAHDSPPFLQPELRWARTDRCGGGLVGRGAEYHERHVRGCPGLHHDGAFGHQQDGWLWRATPSTLHLERSRQAFFVLAAHRPRCMRCNWHGTEPVPTFCRPVRLANDSSCSCPRPLTTPRSSQPH